VQAAKDGGAGEKATWEEEKAVNSGNGGTRSMTDPQALVQQSRDEIERVKKQAEEEQTASTQAHQVRRISQLSCSYVAYSVVFVGGCSEASGGAHA